jgi:hypothetical protein
MPRSLMLHGRARSAFHTCHTKQSKKEAPAGAPNKENTAANARIMNHWDATARPEVRPDGRAIQPKDNKYQSPQDAVELQRTYFVGSGARTFSGRQPSVRDTAQTRTTIASIEAARNRPKSVGIRDSVYWDATGMEKRKIRLIDQP